MRPAAISARGSGAALWSAGAALASIGSSVGAGLAVGGRAGVWLGIGLLCLLAWRWSFAMFRRAQAAGDVVAAGRYRLAVIGLPLVIVAALVLLLAHVR